MTYRKLHRSEILQLELVLASALVDYMQGLDSEWHKSIIDLAKVFCVLVDNNLPKSALKDKHIIKTYEKTLRKINMHTFSLTVSKMEQLR